MSTINVISNTNQKLITFTVVATDMHRLWHGQHGIIAVQLESIPLICFECDKYDTILFMIKIKLLWASKSLCDL